MSLQCPFCGTTHVQPHAVIHADGTQRVQLNHVGAVDGQFMQASSSGTQMTALAQHCAPPSPVSPMPFVVAFGFGSLVVYWGAIEHFPRINWQWTLGGLALIGVGWLLFKGWAKEAQDYSTAKRRWQNTWFCHACGRSHVRD